jgi:hypothetical protein
MRMRKIAAGIALASGVFAIWTAFGRDGQAQAPPGVQSVGGAPGTLFSVPAAPATYSLEEALLRWPLPVGGERYAVIDGRRLHTFVDEQASLSRRFRDQGHPQYWGRIIGTSADAESAQWLYDKFRQAGLSDVRIQPLSIPMPVWEPVQPWEVAATFNGTTVPLTSAQPPYEGTATPPEGLDLDAVYVGTGSDADFAGRDVRGKAAVIYSVPFPSATWQTAISEGIYRRAEEKGAAAILVILALPGNFRVQGYLTRGKVPTFALGMEDGYKLRHVIGLAPPTTPPRVRIRFATRAVSGQSTATVWGTLPGTTDETVYVMAHRDGWFDGAGDNASGVATMIGLAEYYARRPKAQRRRTIVFMGVSGHHGPGMSSQDLLARKSELFAKTALLINAEHTATLQTSLYWDAIRWANTYTAQYWYAGGPSRPKLQEIAIKAFRDFGVSTYAAPERGAPPGDSIGFYRFVPTVTSTDFNMYFHSDGETPETVPWTGLEATTRAYARIIDDVNKLDLKDLQRPEERMATDGDRP